MDLKAGKELVRFASIGAQTVVRRIFSRDDGERFLHQALSSMPGAPAKMGQLLGMRAATDIAAPDPMPLVDVKRIIAEESPSLFAEIASLSEWSRTASIGQTHQARLRSGALVAIKVQYSGVKEALAAQIEAIFGVAGLSPARKYQFDIEATKNFLRQKLLEESDYQFEAQSQLKFFQRYHGSNVVIPSVYSQFSSDRILTQSWEDSISLTSLKSSAAGGLRDKAGAVATAWLFDSMFGLGILHTDLNPSNYGFRVSGDSVQFVLYDFGSTYSFSQQTAVILYQWLAGTREKDLQKIAMAMEMLGFSGARLDHISSDLLNLSEALFKPLLVDSLWRARDWQLQMSLDTILGENKWWFRTAGPPWFMYFMRSLQGWHHLLCELDASVDLAGIWWPWEQQLRFLAMRSPLPVQQQKNLVRDDHDLKATYLKVLVMENGEELVALTMPARAVEELEDLLPEHVRAKCVLDGVDLIAIKNNVIGNGGTPQELFKTAHGARQYRVWLE